MASIASIAQSSIEGVISSGDEKLGYVFVTLEGTNFSAASNQQGKFVIRDIPAGNYTLLARFLGYKPFKKELDLQNGQQLKLTVDLESDALGLEEFTVTGNRGEENRRSSTVTVNVLNKQQLENISANTFSEGIKFSPGIRTETNCQNCGFSQVRINGLPGTYSQILIDGRATFSALNSIYGLEQIPVEMIDRIEVVKGGSSALYGSSAIGGTINLITSEPTKNSFSVRSETGVISGDAWDNRVGFNGSVISPDFKKGLMVFGSARSRQEYDHNGDGYSELPFLNNIGTGFRGYVKTGNYGKLNAEFHALSEYRRGGNLIHLEPHEADVAEELSSNVFGGGLSYDLFGKNKRSKTNFYSSMQSTLMDNYYGAGQDVDGYGSTTDLSWISGIQHDLDHTGIFKSKSKLVAGAEYKLNDMSDEKPGYNLFIDQNLRTAGVFAQYESYFNARFKVGVGARYDWFNLNNQGNLSPRVNLLFNATDQVRFRAGYARGFRIPQIFSEDVHVELVAGEVQAIRLSPDLEAELSDSYTASMDWDRNLKKGNMEVVVEAFYTRIHNPFILEMQSTNSPVQVLERRNGSGASVVGSNIEFKITDNKFYALQTSFTLLNSEYDEPVQWSDNAAADQYSTRFFRTPDYYGNLALDIYPTKKLTTVLTGLYTGPMIVQHYAGFVSEDVLEESPHFFDLGLKVNYDFNLKKKSKLSLYTGVKNLLNSYQSDFDQGPLRDASYVYGPQQPRTIYLGLKYALN